MDYQALAAKIANRLDADHDWDIQGDSILLRQIAEALKAESVTVSNTDGVPVTVYLSISEYIDGGRCCMAHAVDSADSEAYAMKNAFNPDDTHRCKATIYVPPVVIPEVEGEVIG